MSQVGRIVKNIETPRPLLKSQSSRSQLKNYMHIEELIQLIENVAVTLSTGISSPEPMALLVSNLRIHGPELESVSKDTLDRAFVTFRNASQDERLNIMTRLNLLELIELRAKSWKDDGINTYYKHKATNVEPENETVTVFDQTSALSISPTPLSGISLNHTIGISTTAHILGPGELIRNSGKFLKPTKIPGKNYSKDEIVIRNADSGKVNPGAKERLVQITGPNEEKINYAKHLIEDTIRRNASPVRLEPKITGHGGNGGTGGSCSSLASSASDEAVPKTLNQTHANALTKLIIPSSGNNPVLLHSFSTNDASLGEYKYTVNVGQHLLKITGDCCELVRVAKLVLDDYFSSSEFLASMEAGVNFSSTSIPTTPVNSSFTPTHKLTGFQFGDDNTNVTPQFNHQTTIKKKDENIVVIDDDDDDDVFIVENNGLPTTPITVNRSRRMYFTRNDSEEKQKKTGNENKIRIVYEYERLLHYSKSPQSWALPSDWKSISEKFNGIIRNTNLNDEQNRFNPDKYLEIRNTEKRKLQMNPSNSDLESPDPE